MCWSVFPQSSTGILLILDICTFQLFCIKALSGKWHIARLDSVTAEVRDSVHAEGGFWTPGWILSNLGDLFLFILFTSTVLIDSSFWERSSALFFIVWDFCPCGPSHPKFLHDEEGCTDFFFSLFSALVFLEWPFHTLVFKWPCRSCQTKTCITVFLMDALYFSDLGESVIIVKSFSGW